MNEVTQNVPTDRLIDEKEAAMLLSISPKTLQQARVTGNKNYPEFLKRGRNIRYRLSRVMAIVNGPEYRTTIEADEAQKNDGQEC